MEITCVKRERVSKKGGPARVALRLAMLIAAGAGFAMVSCGTAATLHITAPSSTVAGSPFTVTVAATIGARPDTVINSRIHFTSSDSAATLPGDYYYTPADAGSHTFPNGVILRSTGSQSITVFVVDASGLTATATVSVSP